MSDTPEHDEDLYEPIRRGYHRRPRSRQGRARISTRTSPTARWEIRRFGLWAPPAGSRVLAIFGPLPPGFEVAGVRIDTWDPDERTQRLVVNGITPTYASKAAGTWFELPFSHVWSFADGCVDNVYNVLQSFEVRRHAVRGLRRLRPRLVAGRLVAPADSGAAPAYPRPSCSFGAADGLRSRRPGQACPESPP